VSAPKHVRTHRFDADTLYVQDTGIIKCGAHVGTEATYTPERWDALTSAEIEKMELACEDTRCARKERS